MKFEYSPDRVSCPGVTLQDWLHEKNMTKAEFATLCNVDEVIINGIIRGTLLIDEEYAKLLEFGTNIPIEFWINRERIYRESLNI